MYRTYTKENLNWQLIASKKFDGVQTLIQSVKLGLWLDFKSHSRFKRQNGSISLSGRSLLYLATKSKPDLSLVVSMIVSHVGDPEKAQTKSVNHRQQYLKHIRMVGWLWKPTEVLDWVHIVSRMEDVNQVGRTIAEVEQLLITKIPCLTMESDYKNLFRLAHWKLRTQLFQNYVE